MVQPSNPNTAILEPAILTLGGQSYRLPVVEGSEGERAIDISNLRAQTGHITLDPGYGNTGSCESAITFIDGDQGILRYRGIPIEEFAASPTFIEVALLLIFGHLPNQAEYDEFSADLTRFAYLDEGMKHQFEGFPAQCPAHGHPLGHDQLLWPVSTRNCTNWRINASFSMRRRA